MATTSAAAAPPPTGAKEGGPDSKYFDDIEGMDLMMDDGEEEEEEAYLEASVKLELAAATVAWLRRSGGTWHPGLILDEKARRGVCVMVDPEGGGVPRGETLVRVPKALTICSASAAADADVARVAARGGEKTEAFGLLLLYLLKRLGDRDAVEAHPYLAYLETCCDDRLLKPPAVGEGALRDYLWGLVDMQDAVFQRAALPLLRGDPVFGAVDASRYGCARKLLETRAFQLNGRAASRLDALQALVPCIDLVNYASPSPTTLVVDDDAVRLVALADLPPDHGEVTWDYASATGSPLVLLTQYGFLPDALEGDALRHVIPLRLLAESPVARVLDAAAADAPDVDGATDGPLRRRRAANVRFCVDLEATPIARALARHPSAVVFWVDVDAPDEAPLLLALRAALAPPDELKRRDRTVADWIRPLPGDAEANARKAFKDAAQSNFADHWKSAGCESHFANTARDYQISHLSRLGAAAPPNSRREPVAIAPGLSHAASGDAAAGPDAGVHRRQGGGRAVRCFAATSAAG